MLFLGLENELRDQTGSEIGGFRTRRPRFLGLQGPVRFKKGVIYNHKSFCRYTVSGWYFPTPQSLQSAAAAWPSSSKYLPATHATHSSWVVSPGVPDQCPFGQSLQTLVAWPSESQTFQGQGASDSRQKKTNASASAQTKCSRLTLPCSSSEAR